jgi:hypothetical protein
MIVFGCFDLQRTPEARKGETCKGLKMKDQAKTDAHTKP